MIRFCTIGKGCAWFRSIYAFDTNISEPLSRFSNSKWTKSNHSFDWITNKQKQPENKYTFYYQMKYTQNQKPNPILQSLSSRPARPNSPIKQNIKWNSPAERQLLPTISYGSDWLSATKLPLTQPFIRPVSLLEKVISENAGSQEEKEKTRPTILGYDSEYWLGLGFGLG